MTSKPERVKKATNRPLPVRAAWERLLERGPVWVVVFVMVGMWVLAPDRLFQRRDVSAGQIANRDYVAPRDLLIPDELTTEDKRARARESVLPVYDFDESLALQVEDQVTRLFARGRELVEQPVAQPQRGSIPESEEAREPAIDAGLRELQEIGLRIRAPHFELFERRDFSPGLEDRVKTLLRSAMRAGVVGNKNLLLENRMRGVSLRNLQSGAESVELDLYAYRGYPEEVREFFEVEVGGWSGLQQRDRQLVIEFLVDNATPNISHNLSETRARQIEAAGAVEPSYNQIRGGQMIARKGDALTPTAVALINEAYGGPRIGNQLLPLVGNLLLLSLVVLGLTQGLRRSRLASEVDTRTLGGVLLLMALALLMVRFGLFLSAVLSQALETAPLTSEPSYRLAIPYAALALVTSLVYGRGIALLVTVGFGVLVGRMVGNDALGTVIFVLATSLAAIYALDRLKQRSAVTRAGLVVGLTGMAVSLMLATFDAQTLPSPVQVGFDVLCAMAGGLLVAAATSFLVPILEWLLSATTDIKLLELSDTNLPLLRRVAFEAPGTFQHSLMVANMAKAGCEAIGANPVLAYTGGLYHDVGKVFRPLYFVENQMGGENPHDRLAPSMSRLIVINHVKEGVQLAKEYHLPRPIIDAIEQHHGTRMLSFFLKRAQELSPDEEVEEAKYRYPGPKPQNKVMGVLMYADAVEAASRTLRDPSPVALRSLLRRLLDDCMQDGQLDESDLTLSDLRKVSDAFYRVLQNIHHKRIDYPGYDFNEPKRQLRVVEGSH
ncbi:MAG TPA: HDIG domain-containing protein [Thermoanaerobaculia bacterium]|nr:HDIG domain-containing protein [Thermoanaerobaculia bacterium]